MGDIRVAIELLLLKYHGFGNLAIPFLLLPMDLLD